jgi:hypothetical protein
VSDNRATFSYALSVPDEFAATTREALAHYGVVSGEDLIVHWLYALYQRTEHDSIVLEAWMKTALLTLAKYPESQHPMALEILERHFDELKANQS